MQTSLLGANCQLMLGFAEPLKKDSFMTALTKNAKRSLTAAVWEMLIISRL